MHKFLIFLFIFLTFSCNKVNTPNVKVEIERFEDIFFKSDANNLYKVKEDFSYNSKDNQHYLKVEELKEMILKFKENFD